MGQVYSIPDGYWAGYRISFKMFRGYGLGMGLGDARPDYPKPHNRLPELYTQIVFNLYFFSINPCLLVIYFSMFVK
ncbi:hypothetical protein Hanom_Chr12g01155211 [Helianthus anomalus]